MKTEEAISIIEKADAFHVNPCTADIARRIAIKAMKKQIPRNPYYEFGKWNCRACGSCHSKLTPKSELTKLGIRYHRIPIVQAEEFYKRVNEFCCESEEITAGELFDIFDSCIRYDVQVNRDELYNRNGENGGGQ